ncbi:hypothetical protein [Falsibacillus pallidus]|uniref:hypothetical protein n=1 Tax=Falsibacillus pallidus TaxID=493781 RepID=UPI003D990D18
MTKRRKISMFLALVLVIAIFLVYWFYLAKPSGLPTEKEILSIAGREDTTIRPDKIQDILSIDSTHVLVPIITSEDTYGLIFMVWKHHKWTMDSIVTNGSPRIWTLKKNDPSSQYIVWNMHPDDQLGQIDFYLLKRRSYSGSGGISTYEPGTQMKTPALLNESTYGFKKLPKDWAYYMEKFKDTSRNAPQSILENFFSNSPLYVAWLPLNQKGQSAFPERSVNGESYHTGDQIIDQLFILGNEDLEGMIH